MSSIYNLINRHFSYSNIEFYLIPGITDNKPYILIFEHTSVVSDKKICSVFDENLNLIIKNVKHPLNESNSHIYKVGVTQDKKGEYILKPIDANPYNIVNYVCSNSFYTDRFGGTFLGLIKPNEERESYIATKINNEVFIPVIIFNSHSPHLAISSYKDQRGRISPWIGDGDDLIFGSNVKEYPWVIYFCGNDDANYYCRFKTYYEAITVWEIMREKNIMSPSVDFSKHTDIKDIYNLQTHDKLFYIYQN